MRVGDLGPFGFGGASQRLAESEGEDAEEDAGDGGDEEGGPPAEGIGDEAAADEADRDAESSSSSPD